MTKPQRIRDPIHDLIEFDLSDFEQLAWSLIDSVEFQRLRRIKQLGFSELVFPGATHSRFSHSVGVFHIARQLSGVIRRLLGEAAFEVDHAMAAALVHDLGHGPFSHAFEDAAAKLAAKKKHEDWTAEIIRGDTEVGKKLGGYGEPFRASVAELLASDTPRDLYAAIVSSQFDADRLSCDGTDS
jgi:HD superfamily phosphohydrolase